LGTDVRLLSGHSGPVYSTSFNPDNSFLISGSEDGTGESSGLSLHSQDDLCVRNQCKGHNIAWCV